MPATLPYKSIQIPERSAITVDKENGSVLLDLSAFQGAEPDPELQILFSRAEDGTIKADGSEKIQELVHKTYEQTTYDENLPGSDQILQELVFFGTDYDPEDSRLPTTARVLQGLVYEVSELPDYTRYPYDYAGANLASQLGTAFRHIYHPAEGEEDTLYWSHALERSCPQLYNWAQTFPELPQLCQENPSYLNLVKSYAGSARRQTHLLSEKVSSKRELLSTATGGLVKRNTYMKPLDLPESVLGKIYQLMEANLLPEIHQLGLRRLAQDHIRFFGCVAVEELSPAGASAEELSSKEAATLLPSIEEILASSKEDPIIAEALRSGLSYLSNGVSSNSTAYSIRQVINYLVEEEDFRQLVRQAAAASDQDTFDWFRRFFKNSKGGEAAIHPDVRSFPEWKQVVLEKLSLSDTDYAFDLAQTQYQDDVPDSDVVDVSILGSVEEFQQSLVDTGAMLLAFSGNWDPTKLKGTRYIFEVLDQQEGSAVGYLFMTDYFKTNYSWRVNRGKFEKWYGKIRYRVSAIRKNCRVIEEHYIAKPLTRDPSTMPTLPSPPDPKPVHKREPKPFKPLSIPSGDPIRVLRTGEEPEVAIDFSVYSPRTLNYTAPERGKYLYRLRLRKSGRIKEGLPGIFSNYSWTQHRRDNVRRHIGRALALPYREDFWDSTLRFFQGTFLPEIATRSRSRSFLTAEQRVLLATDLLVRLTRLCSRWLYPARNESTVLSQIKTNGLSAYNKWAETEYLRSGRENMQLPEHSVKFDPPEPAVSAVHGPPS